MSKYDPLRTHLSGRPRGEFMLTFREIEQVLGFPLPASAQRPQWWANTTEGGGPQLQAWRAAGLDAFLVAGSKKVRFHPAR